MCWTGLRRCCRAEDCLKSSQRILSAEKLGEYVNGLWHANALEGDWSQLKRSLFGTRIHASPKHLANYLGEYEYHHNLRKTPELMFPRLMSSL